MIPYFDLPVYDIPLGPLGSIPLDPWGTLVVIGFVLGLEMARARGIREGLDVRDVIDGLTFTVLAGFVGGHLVHVLAYHPEQLAESGDVAGIHFPPVAYALVRIWAGFSSFGGFLGAVLGGVTFYTLLRKRPFWPHADAIMYGFPFAWVFGRLGCFSVHDHIGKATDFFLAVKFPFGTRFDLGLLEALWAMVISAAFLFFGRKSRPGGFFLALWCVMYAPVRFGLDFLRNTDLQNADVRWSGLTPAQWGCIAMFGAGIALWARLARRSGRGEKGESGPAEEGTIRASP